MVEYQFSIPIKKCSSSYLLNALLIFPVFFDTIIVTEIMETDGFYTIKKYCGEFLEGSRIELLKLTIILSKPTGPDPAFFC